MPATGDLDVRPAPEAPVPAEPAAPTVPVPANPGPAFAVPAPAGMAQVVGQVLPIYFVGDESHSMAGDPIEAVNHGLADLRDEVAKHPLIGKKVRFGIITFAHSAETRLELSELTEDLLLPTLSPRGRGTSYASAFEALRQTIPGDVALLKSGGYQVHRPVVFFLSDGQPTERERKWHSAPARAEGRQLQGASQHPRLRRRRRRSTGDSADRERAALRVHDDRRGVDRGRDLGVRDVDAQLDGRLRRAAGSRRAHDRVREAGGLRAAGRAAALAAAMASKSQSGAPRRRASSPATESVRLAPSAPAQHAASCAGPS